MAISTSYYPVDPYYITVYVITIQIGIELLHACCPSVPSNEHASKRSQDLKNRGKSNREGPGTLLSGPLSIAFMGRDGVHRPKGGGGGGRTSRPNKGTSPTYLRAEEGDASNDHGGLVPVIKVSLHRGLGTTQGSFHREWVRGSTNTEALL